MARGSDEIKPVFPDDTVIIDNEEKKEPEDQPEDQPEAPKDKEPKEDELDDGEPEVEESEGPKEPEEDDTEIDYLEELARKQRQRKKLKQLEREIKEVPTVRKTFLVEEELLKEILKLSDKYGYAFQRKFINSAIRRELERIKKLEKKRKQS